MGWLSRLFARDSKPTAEAVQPVEYKGFLIYQEPVNEHGQYRVSGRITQDVDGELKTHQFIRSDVLPSQEEAKALMLRKAQLYIDQMNGKIFF